MNKKKLLSFILCLCVLLSCILLSNKLPVAVGGASANYESAEPVIPAESDFIYRKTPVTKPTKAVITKYTGKETKVIIPETLEGLPVSSISEDAFAENEKLTYVKLPATLVAVSGKAFNKCSSLMSFDIDPKNRNLAVVDGVLYQKDVDPDSATYGKVITLIAFPAGKGGHFTVPYGVTTISAYAFDYCYNLTSVDMYNTVTAINDHAFSFCWGLESIRLSDNLKTLGDKALAHCDSLSRIDLPTNLTSIGDDAFLGDIGSDDTKFYYFTNGISCTKYSSAHSYISKLGLPSDIIILNNRSITDNDTGIMLIDAYKGLTIRELHDISVKPVELEEVKEILPTRYAKAYAFDIDILKNTDVYKPKKDVIFDFTAICPDAIPSATKVYQQIGDELVLVSGSAHTPFVGAQVSEGGRFIILTNDDFSLKGDVDGDGTVTLFDVKASMHASIGTLVLTPEQQLAANVDNSTDGKITTQDARKILRLAGGMSIE